MEQEKQWIKQIKSRNSKAAANSLIEYYYREIYRYTYRQTLNQELAMDLSQEIFISVLKSIRHYDEKKGSFRTWLYRIATNKIVDYYRSKYHQYSRMTMPITDYEPCDHEDFTISIEYKEETEKMIELVSQLDVSSQQIFRLRLFGEYSFLEIAGIMKIPESTVKTRYYSLVRKIKKHLGEEQR